VVGIVYYFILSVIFGAFAIFQYFGFTADKQWHALEPWIWKPFDI
jgi:hypothetical protein